MHEQRTQKWEKDVTTWVHLFGLTDKATWQPRDLSRVSLNSQSTCFGSKNRPFYRYGGHIEIIRFKEYYGIVENGFATNGAL